MTTKQLKKLREELATMTRWWKSEETSHKQTLAKLEVLQGRLKEHQERDWMRERGLEDQTQWLRDLLEVVVIPADKLKILHDKKNDVRIHGRPVSPELNLR